MCWVTRAIHTALFLFQGLKSCSEEMRADEEYMVSLWQHEVTRVVKDRLCRSVDIKWFEKNLKAIVKEVNFSSQPATFLSLFACLSVCLRHCYEYI